VVQTQVVQVVQVQLVKVTLVAQVLHPVVLVDHQAVAVDQLA
jgi:hypothetical protein